MKRKKPTSSPGKSRNPSFAPPELEQIEQLLKFMTDHNLEEFEYARGDLRIRLRKPSSEVVMTRARTVAPEIIVASAPVASGGRSGEPAGTAAPEARATEDLHMVKSPIVGTFYEAPSPGAEPFVTVGGYIEAGQTLCIVEAMKLMNEIESDVSGEVIRIFAENGQPVEYGQPLFGVRPSRKK